MSQTIYHLNGHLLGFPIVETYNTLPCAITRLDNLAASANEIAEGSPDVRSLETTLFLLTDAPLPELMNVMLGETLVRIEEQIVT